MKTDSDSPTKLTIFSVALGSAVSVVLTLFSHGHEDFVTDATAGLAVAILTFQISELWHHRKLSPQLASLERVLKDPEFFDTVTETIDLWEQTRDIKRKNPRCADFYVEKEAELFGKMVSELKSLSRGDIKIENEARELAANRDFLLKLPERKVCAISYQDDSFWVEEPGKKFLAAHKVAIHAKVEITRIFILDAAALVTQKSVIQNQIDLGINCQVVNEASIPAVYREDFVIYDDKYVRFAKLVAQTQQTTLKTATLTSDRDTVGHYRQMYDYLSLRAVNAKVFYDKLADPPNPIIPSS